MSLLDQAREATIGPLTFRFTPEVDDPALGDMVILVDGLVQSVPLSLSTVDWCAFMEARGALVELADAAQRRDDLARDRNGYASLAEWDAHTIAAEERIVAAGERLRA